MYVVLNGITEGMSMQVRQPVNEGGSENGKDEPRLFKMTRSGSDGSSGDDRAGDYALAVDHSQWVAFNLHMPSAAVLIHGQGLLLNGVRSSPES
jgi:hypothetical protein